MKFLVIEGLDGSGKSTQVNNLVQYLKEEDVSFEYLHFPRTVTGVYGDLIARFLRGDLGDIDQVNPYLVALLFAGDRHDAAVQIRQWISENKLVLVDRYVYSNIAYQCAKLNSLNEQKSLMQWILDAEYNYFNIPKPDLSLFLRVPFSFIESKLKDPRNGSDREYLMGKGDIHEKDMNFQRKVRAIYDMAIAENSDIVPIECTDKTSGEMKSELEIFEAILSELKKNGF
jgi:dTMP kinase